MRIIKSHEAFKKEKKMKIITSRAVVTRKIAIKLQTGTTKILKLTLCCDTMFVCYVARLDGLLSSFIIVYYSLVVAVVDNDNCMINHRNVTYDTLWRVVIITRILPVGRNRVHAVLTFKAIRCNNVIIKISSHKRAKLVCFYYVCGCYIIFI